MSGSNTGATGLALPKSAAWYTSLATGRWDWTAMGSLLVLLNTENPAVAAALPDPASGRTSPDAATIFDTLEVDFLTDLVGRALDDEGFHDLYVVNGDEAILRLHNLRAQDASMFRAEVQHGLGYPRSRRS